MFAKSFWVTIALGLFVCKASSQMVSRDTLQYSDATKQVIAHYIAAIGDQSELYNGTQYHLYEPANKGSAYFQDRPTLMPATVCYNRTWYKNVPVLYDMYADIMVSALKDSLYALRADKLSEIFLSGHHFIYLNNQNNKNLVPGFYDQLYSGKSEVLVKRTRTVQKTVTQVTVEVTYENKDIIYIRNGTGYTQVSNKASVLANFKDKIKQLKQYLNESKISFKKDKEQSIVILASYYDQLTN
jgi:hypothetical protein